MTEEVGVFHNGFANGQSDPHSNLDSRIGRIEIRQLALNCQHAVRAALGTGEVIMNPSPSALTSVLLWEFIWRLTKASWVRNTERARESPRRSVSAVDSTMSVNIMVTVMPTVRMSNVIEEGANTQNAAMPPNSILSPSFKITGSVPSFLPFQVGVVAAAGVGNPKTGGVGPNGGMLSGYSRLVYNDIGHHRAVKR